MKHLLFVLATLLLNTINAQTSEIKTTILKAEDLITHAAENDPSETTNTTFLLVETGAAGIKKDDIFYLKKGLQLFLKRSNEENSIAIGVYGAANAIILNVTPISEVESINLALDNLIKGTFPISGNDGIELAYDLIQHLKDDDIENTMIIVRGTAKIITDISEKNAYTSNNRGNASVLPSDKKITKKEKRALRKENKAVQHSSVGGAIALTALTILPELLEVIKD